MTIELGKYNPYCQRSVCIKRVTQALFRWRRISEHWLFLRNVPSFIKSQELYSFWNLSYHAYTNIALLFRLLIAPYAIKNVEGFQNQPIRFSTFNLVPSDRGSIQILFFNEKFTNEKKSHKPKIVPHYTSMILMHFAVYASVLLEVAVIYWFWR